MPDPSPLRVGSSQYPAIHKDALVSTNRRANCKKEKNGRKEKEKKEGSFVGALLRMSAKSETQTEQKQKNKNQE
jgi:hypothetical protein